MLCTSIPRLAQFPVCKVKSWKKNGKLEWNQRYKMKIHFWHLPSDLDECASSELNDCHSSATCANSWGGFTCACKQGFKDPQKNDPSNAGRSCLSCPSSHCNNRGTCSYQNDQMQCSWVWVTKKNGKCFAIGNITFYYCFKVHWELLRQPMRARWRSFGSRDRSFSCRFDNHSFDFGVPHHVDVRIIRILQIFIIFLN